MSKIGRNDPCPCGSGKKYKKCCIDKPWPEVQQDSFAQYLHSFWSYEEANAMTTEEIIGKLESLGVPFDDKLFLSDVEKFYSAQQLSDNWFDTYKVTAVDRDEDFLCFASWILWERLAPPNILSMEQMADLIDKGYAYSYEKDYKSACDLWLVVWEAIKFRIKSEFKNLDYLNQQYQGSFFISNFCQDLEQELHNAGLDDSVYLEKRIEYCTEFCSFFPEENELIVHNMRRAICEAYARLMKFDEATIALDSLVTDYPNNPWSYIEYGDMYLYGNDLIKDPVKAKELYCKALMAAEDEFDKQAVEERLEDIKID